MQIILVHGTCENTHRLGRDFPPLVKKVGYTSYFPEISPPIKIKEPEIKTIMLYVTVFQGHVGTIGSRGAVGPQGQPVNQ